MHDWPADMTTAVQGVYPSSLSDLEVKVQMHGPSSDTAHHSTRSRQGSLMRFVADQGHNHAVQVEEEHQEVETQFDERFLHRLVTHICVRKQKKKGNTPSCARSACGRSPSHPADAGSRRSWNRQLSVPRGRFRGVREHQDHVLLRIKCQQRQVQHNRNPVSIDDKQEGQEPMDRGFGDNVGVQTVAEVNRVDVVTTFPHESASMSFPSRPSAS